MKYFYYPGCSLEGTAREYNASTKALMGVLGAELIEIEDWTCCGASAAENMSYLLSMVLSARNVALAEKIGGWDLMIPCSACYLNFKKLEDHAGRDGSLRATINEALEVEGLHYSGGVRARHLLDILTTDFGAESMKRLVRNKLTHMSVAPYYGCQALRPYRVFDDPERPVSMEPILEALGARVHPWSMGAKCCGAGLMTTKKDVAIEAVTHLLFAAKGADCIATVCPMCRMNLEAYQKKASRLRGEDLAISVLYLPQLILRSVE